MNQLVRSPLPGLPFDVAVGDLDELLTAVKARLTQTVGERRTAAGEAPAPDNATQVRASVLDCVMALDQLQITLAHELARREHLERELFNSQAALARACAEHAGGTEGSSPRG